MTAALDAIRVCARCRAPLPPHAGPGRPRLYCSAKCAQETFALRRPGPRQWRLLQAENAQLLAALDRAEAVVAAAKRLRRAQRGDLSNMGIPGTIYRLRTDLDEALAAFEDADKVVDG